jgi:23S rRNA pseudouridine2605 synthase
VRLNKFLAHFAGLSRRQADDTIAAGQVSVNDQPVRVGQQISETDVIKLDEKIVKPLKSRTIMLNKPVGYVCSRRAQGNAKTVYDILPREFASLKTVGRLDKNSSGLILLTNDGDSAQRLTHPKFAKTKIYLVRLDKNLAPLHQQMISDFGINLPDGNSKLTLESLDNSAGEVASDGAAPKNVFSARKKFLGVDQTTVPVRPNTDSRKSWRVIMHEGRNRQIRRTFAALGYRVVKLHRTDFDSYHLENLKPGEWREITD